jgi:hypothetical protein
LVTDRGDVLGIDLALGERLLDHVLSALPNLHRVMLNPAGFRVNLFVFPLVDFHYLAAMIEDHEASAGSALIDCSCILSHRIASVSEVGPLVSPGIQPGVGGGLEE